VHVVGIFVGFFFLQNQFFGCISSEQFLSFLIRLRGVQKELGNAAILAQLLSKPQKSVTGAENSVF
jgi:hypothetical protein